MLKGEMLSDLILPFLAKVVAYGSGAVVIAYFVFRFLGKSWIENKFAEKLADFKHQQVLEIQRLRIKIDSMLSGVLKLQEKEFETLPEAWCKLDKAYGQVQVLTSPAQRYPNLDGMTLARLEEFLNDSVLLTTQKDEIRQSKEKGRAFQEAIFWHNLQTVNQACADLHNYVARYGIFFPPELKEKFTKVAEDLWSAVSYKTTGHEAKDYNLQNEGWKKIKDEIEPLYKVIESDIHARLRSHGRS